MKSKATHFTDNSQLIHMLPAGAIPGDHSIEIFGDRKTKKTYFASNGVVQPFRKLSQQYKNKLFSMIMADPIAMEDLKNLPYNEALETYAYCMYGSLDHVPDITVTGVLGASENFICNKEGCNCQNWLSKQITYNNHVIKGRLLDVLLAYRKGREDAHVAEDLNIEIPTLNTYKKRLFGIFGVYSKTEMVILAIESGIIQ